MAAQNRVPGPIDQTPVKRIVSAHLLHSIVGVNRRAMSVKRCLAAPVSARAGVTCSEQGSRPVKRFTHDVCRQKRRAVSGSDPHRSCGAVEETFALKHPQRLAGHRGSDVQILRDSPLSQPLLRSETAFDDPLAQDLSDLINHRAGLPMRSRAHSQVLRLLRRGAIPDADHLCGGDYVHVPPAAVRLAGRHPVVDA